MPNPERALSLARNFSSQTVKPEPPADLWAKMDSLVEASALPREKPPGAFTAREFAEKYQVSQAVATKHINKLIKAGKVKFIGNGGHCGFLYAIVE